MEIRHTERESQHTYGLDKQTRDALADFCRRRWPQHTAKRASHEWSLSLDEARGVVAGRTSLATLDRIFKHKRGGWAVIVPVMGAVVGQSLEQFTASQIEEIRNEQAELEAMGEGLRDRYARLRGVRPGGPGRSFVDGEAIGGTDRDRSGQH